MWEEYVQELREYKQKFGHCCVPNDDKYRNLYDWIQHVRSSYKHIQRGEEPSIELDDDLVANLKSIGLGLSQGESIWKRRLKELLKFRNVNGHFQVPPDSTEYRRLAGWLLELQKEYIRREQGEDVSILTGIQLDKLEKIGYSFKENLFQDAVQSRKAAPSNHDRLWRLRLQELKDFKEKYGHFRVPGDEEAYKSLWHWMRNNNIAYSKMKNGETNSRLTKDRLADLKHIGFTFSKSLVTSDATGSHNDLWDQRIQELREFKELHGHFGVPANVEKYKQLANWMINNQAHYNKIRKREKSTRLTSERLIQLMDLGFTFSLPARSVPSRMINDAPSDRNERWNLRVKELEAFKKAHGHFRIPVNNPDYIPLRNWISNNQTEYNSKIQKGIKSSRLTDKRLAKLESIGFKFSARNEDDQVLLSSDERWNLRVRELEAFKSANGHFRIPANSAEYKQLLAWIRKNQVEYAAKVQKGMRSSRLTDERLAQLESIGFQFDTGNEEDLSSSDPEERWNLRVKELEAFKKEHGHFRIPSDNEQYKGLWHWMFNNRTEYRKVRRGMKSSRLTDQRLAQLESIGFRFTDAKNEGKDREEQWNQRVKELEAFKKQHGNFRIPSSSEKYKQLARWVRNLQSGYNKMQKGIKSSRLTEERLAQLESIGFSFVATSKNGDECHAKTPGEKSRTGRGEECTIANSEEQGNSGMEAPETNYEHESSGASQRDSDSIHECSSEPATGTEPSAFHQDSNRFVETDRTINASPDVDELDSFVLMVAEKDQIEEEQANSVSHEFSNQFVEIEHANDAIPDTSPDTEFKFLDDLDETVVLMMAERDRIEKEKANSVSHQHPSRFVEIDASPAAIPDTQFSFLDGLDETVVQMMAERDRIEQEKASTPIARMGKPNQFWLDIGDRDGIRF